MSKIALSGNASGTGTLTIAAPNTNSDFTLSLPATTAPILAGSGITLSASAPANTLVTTDAGNLAVGTATAAARLTVGGASQNDTGAATFPGTIQLKEQGLSTVQATGGIEFKGSFSGSGYGSKITGTDDGQMLFGTRANSASFTERARINADGTLMVGTATPLGRITSENSSGDCFYANTSNASTGFVYRTTASDGTAGYWITSAGQAGLISVSGNTTSYTSGSDYRLKENIRPLANALEKVATLKPVAFEWKTSGAYSESFLAHELAGSFPFAVVGEKDAVDADGKPQYQGIDTSFLVATLTAAIQELNAKVDAQAAEIAALKGQA
jgi:hypothetical protein